MSKKIMNFFKRIKVGAKYKQMINQTYNEYVRNDSALITGAKIKYNAQSTFHTIE